MKRTKTLPKSQPIARRMSPLASWLWGGALVLLVVIVYWPTLANGFIWDDDDYVENNQTLTSNSGLREIWLKPGAAPQYYPLTHSVFWLEYRCWGLNPRGYHVLNLLLHSACAVLVWRLLTRLAVPGAWVAAAIFAVHPVCVESVAWVTEMKNVLSCALALGSLLAYLRFSPADPESEAAAPPSGEGLWRWYVLSFVLYVAAVLSKTVVASAPAVLLVIFWWKRGRTPRRELIRLAPFFAFGLALSAVTIWLEKTHVGASGQDWELTLLDRVLIAGRAVWFYAGKLAWPAPLIFFYPRWTIDSSAAWQYLFPLAAAITVVYLWCARRRIGRGPLAGVLIFAGVLLPALGFFDVFPFRYSFVADHFQYHASIALIAVAVAAAFDGARRLSRRPNLLLLLAAIFVLTPLSVVARHRTQVFKDRTTLHEDTFAQNSTAWVAPLDLGKVEFERGNFDQAISYDQRGIDVLERLVPQTPSLANTLAGSYVNLGFVQQRAGRASEAESTFRKAIEIREKLTADKPAVNEFRIGLAWCYADLALVQSAMGKSAEAEGSFEKAIAAREQLVRENPTVGEYQDVLAGTYIDLGAVQRSARRRTDAAASFLKAIEIRQQLIRDQVPIDRWQNNLAASLVELGLLQLEMIQPAQAESSFRQAIDIREPLVSKNPLDVDLQSALAWTYTHCAIVQQNTAQRAEAAAVYRKAIEIRQQLASDFPLVNAYKIQTATSYVDLAIDQREMGREAEAVKSFSDAIVFQRQLVDANPSEGKYLEELAASYTDIGLLERKLKRYADAEQSFRAAIEIREKLVRADPTIARNRVALAWSDAHLGAVLSDLGSAQAGEFSQQALAMREQLVRDYPSVADYRADLASSYSSRGLVEIENSQNVEAIASSQKAIEILTNLVKENPAVTDYQSRLGSSYANLGKVQLASGHLAEAEASCREAVNIRVKLVQENPTVDDFKDEIASNCRDLGNVYRAMKKRSEATALYRAAVEIRGSMASADPTKLDRQSAFVDDLVLCGDALAAQGNWNEAAELYGRAVGIGPASRSTIVRSALAHVAAGDETAYRSDCANLTARMDSSLPPDDLRATLLALVAGDRSSDEIEKALPSASRAAVGSDPIPQILLGSIQFRAGHLQAAIASLEEALPRIEQAASDAPDNVAWLQVCRLLGSSLLARARHEQNRDNRLPQLTVLGDLAEKTDLILPQDEEGLPPWIIPWAIEIAKREMAKAGADAKSAK